MKPIDALTPLGQTIRHWRKQNRYSLGAMAELAGMSKSHLHHLETGYTTDPQLSTLSALAKVMGHSVGWLANIADKRNAP